MEHEHTKSDIDETVHQKPADAVEGEIVGLPTMLAKYQGQVDAEQILSSLRRIEYPVEDVSVLFRIEGSDQVVDQLTGHMAAGQSLTDEELERKHLEKGQTVVLLHPEPDRTVVVREALASVGPVEIEYEGETHAFGRPGGVVREDE